ncbi:MAG: chemotaxis protein CheW [Nitrospirae bacterium]|nr:chemotaxis protein CheW [Nitrospirota bacterium]MBI5696809.1 chemotaxis protein CheW [Nitrospirota bacterium]
MGAEETTGTTQYLTFTLGAEEFALDIAKVREVLDYTTITRVPRMPDFLRGVINLRGNVVPVVDLRMKLGMPAAERTVSTCIVITEVDLDGETVQMGMLTDSVQEVLDLDQGQVQPPPRFGTKLNTEFIRGMGKRDDRFLIILDIDRVLSGGEIAELQHTGMESLDAEAEMAA